DALAGTTFACAHDLHALQQFLWRAGFLGHQCIGSVNLTIHLLGVSENDHRNVRGDVLEFENELISAHLRHGVISKDKVDLVIGKERNGILPVGGGKHAV